MWLLYRSNHAVEEKLSSEGLFVARGSAFSYRMQSADSSRKNRAMDLLS